MGIFESKPKILPTEKPWRSQNCDGEELVNTLVRDIKKLNPKKKPGIILLGPVAAGKSSFINSCLSVGIGRIKKLALTGVRASSFTIQLLTYTDSLLLKNFRVMDCMGIEQDIMAGFNINDTRNLLEGHIKIGYKFENSNPIDQKSDYYRSNPDVEDKIHCVVLVLTAKTIIDGVQREFVKKINHFLDETRAVGIQRILILTKCDLLCSEVAKDAGNMFRSEIIKKAVDKANQLFAIEINAIHPVINYEVDLHLSTAKNIPIMLALCQILQCASDRVEYELDEH